MVLTIAIGVLISNCKVLKITKIYVRYIESMNLLKLRTVYPFDIYIWKGKKIIF